jgi:ankyrin repeat protein
MEHGRKEAEQIFYNSIFTSWISPCTVWSNNKMMRSKFLLCSAFTTIAINAVAQLFVLFFIDTFEINEKKNPPIFHCFQKSAVANMRNHYQLCDNKNKTDKLFTILDFNEGQLPKIRICTENEASAELLSNTIIPVGLGFNLLSLCAAIGLQMLGNYSNLKLKCPKLLYHSLNEYILDGVLHGSGFENLKQYLKTKDHQQSLKLSLGQIKKMLIYKKGTRALLKNVEETFLKNVKSSENKVWNDLPPMHKAAIDGKMGLWCFLNFIGGEAGALNGQDQTSLDIIFKSIREEVISNLFTKLWIIIIAQKYMTTGIINATKEHDLYLLKLLLENGYNVNEADIDGNTSLHLAVRDGKSDCLKILLEYHADISVKNTAGQTVLLIAAKRECSESLEYLLEYSSHSDKNNYGWTILHLAVRTGDSEALKILLEKNYEINARDNYGSTPLHLAVSVEEIDCLKILLENNVDVNTKDGNGQTALHVAARRQHIDCFLLLLEYSADVNAKDNYGKTPLQTRTNCGGTILHFAVRERDTQFLKYMLEKNADVNAKVWNGETLLHIATKAGKTECLKLLLENNADINLKDDNGQTALHHAAKAGTTKCAELLLENNADINAKGSDGQTALHLAASGDHIQCLKLLLHNNADVYSRDSNGRTALHFAGRKGKMACLKLLVDNNADSNAKDKNGDTTLQLAKR